MSFTPRVNNDPRAKLPDAAPSCCFKWQGRKIRVPRKGESLWDMAKQIDHIKINTQLVVHADGTKVFYYMGKRFNEQGYEI